MQLSRLRQRHENEQGAVAILVALTTCFVFFGLAALVVDLGLARDTSSASQVSSDASALAAANVLYPAGGSCTVANPDGTTKQPCFGDAVKAAKDYAQVNFQVATSAWNGCTDAGAPASYYQPDAGDQCISFDNKTKPTKARVLMPTAKVPVAFGGVYVPSGTNNYKVSTQAQAVVPFDQPHACSLCILGDADSGNADYTVSNGSIEVGGNIHNGPNGDWTANGGSVGVVGAVGNPGGMHPSWGTVPPFTDPFAGMPMPSASGLTKHSNPCTDGPGIYVSDFAIGSNCVLQGGLYVITGEWSEKNNSMLSDAGHGVTLYFTCNTPPTYACPGGQAGGWLYVKNGNTNLTGTPPYTPVGHPVNDPSGAYPPMGIIYDPGNSSDLQLLGNGNGKFSGATYMPAGSLVFNGTSDWLFNAGPLVVDNVGGNGNQGTVTMNTTYEANLPKTAGAPSLDQ